MFNQEVDKRIKLFDKNKVDISNNRICIVEKDTSGKGTINISVSNPCISFKDMRKNGFHYFSNQKTADGLILEYRNGTWYTHVFELKTSLSFDQLQKTCTQLSYSFLNALAIAGYMGINISIENTIFYIAYTTESVSTVNNTSTLELRLNMRNKAIREADKKLLDHWNASLISFPEITDKVFKLCKLQFTKINNERIINMFL